MKRWRSLRKEFDFFYLVYVCWFRKNVVGTEDFEDFLKICPEFQRRSLSRKGMSLDEIREGLASGKIKGLVKASLEIPAEKESIFR